MKELEMSNGTVEDVSDDPFAGMLLRCVECNELTDPTRQADDPKRVVRCLTCGKKHSLDSLRYIGGV